MEDCYKNKYFFHFTHIDNIESIVKMGILSTNEKAKLGINHVNIANEGIQNRRSQMLVTCKPYGYVHDYVPFYFTARNPMLLGIINRKNIDQPYVVYIAISIDKILNENVVFTDASANTAVPPNFYNDPYDLDKLDWDAIDSKSWNEKTDEKRHSRMAEVLILNKVPIDWIDSYIVYNKICKDKIIKIYKELGKEIPKINYEPFANKYYFYYTKYFMPNREKETLIIGPSMLRMLYLDLLERINKNRKEITGNSKLFLNIEDAIIKIIFVYYLN